MGKIWIIGQIKFIIESMDTIEQYWKQVDNELRYNHLSIRQLSMMTGISYSRFASWRSKKRIPDPDALILISKALNVSIDYLLKGSGYANSIDPLILRVVTDNRLRNMVIDCIKNPKLIDAFEIMTNSSSLHSKEIENLQESSPLHPKKSTG